MATLFNTLPLDPLRMPFPANRQFKAAPRLLTEAAGRYYRSNDGREMLNAAAGLWCVNAGHACPQITAAVADQLAQLDNAPPFQMGNPLAFGLVAGIELEPRPDTPGARAYDAFVRAFEQGLLVRVTGDVIALSLPLIIDARSSIASRRSCTMSCARSAERRPAS